VNWFRRALNYFGIIDLVILRDFDGKENLRWKRKPWLNHPEADRWGTGNNIVLFPNGTTNEVVVKSWYNYRPSEPNNAQ
jgi:hypothetical protein